MYEKSQVVPPLRNTSSYSPDFDGEYILSVTMVVWYEMRVHQMIN